MVGRSDFRLPKKWIQAILRMARSSSCNSVSWTVQNATVSKAFVWWTHSRHYVDQDQNLDQLSDAIRRQRELGLIIGDELDTHAQLIDETTDMVDRTDARMQKAKRKLDYVGRKVKENSKLSSDKSNRKWSEETHWGRLESICIVIVLIFVFFVLLALFR